MKRLFSLLMVLTLAAALCLPVWADDSNPDSGINNGGAGIGVPSFVYR